MLISIYTDTNEGITLNEKKEVYFSALYSNDLQKLTKILNQNPEAILYSNNMRETGLHIAIKYKKPEMLAVLLENAKTRPEVMEKLINARDCDGKTPVNAATELNDLASVKTLLPYNPDFTIIGYDYRRGPVHFAATNNNVEMLEVLKNAGVQMDKPAVVESYGWGLPIHFAAAHFAPEAVEFFVTENPEHKDAQTSTGKTPMMIALQAGCEKVVRVLLERNANVLLTDNAGHNALWYADKYNAYYTDFKDIKKAYFEQNGKGLTALLDAINKKKVHHYMCVQTKQKTKA